MSAEWAITGRTTPTGENEFVPFQRSTNYFERARQPSSPDYWSPTPEEAWKKWAEGLLRQAENADQQAANLRATVARWRP